MYHAQCRRICVSTIIVVVLEINIFDEQHYVAYSAKIYAAHRAFRRPYLALTKRVRLSPPAPSAVATTATTITASTTATVVNATTTGRNISRQTAKMFHVVTSLRAHLTFGVSST